jgi:predicted ribosome-associated RNA-binding protein Tma20
MCEECGCGETQPIGEVTHYYGKPHVAVVRADGLIKNGDTVMVKGGTTNFTMTVQGMRDEQELEIDSAHSGQLVAFATPEVARPGDKLYRSEGGAA